MTNSPSLSLFRGRQILIVEDAYFLADEARAKLEQLGATVVRTAAHVQTVRDVIAASRVDAAILDINLGDDLAFPLAETLERAGIEFVFAAGADAGVLPLQFSGFALCDRADELAKIAAALFGTGRERGLN